MSTDKNHEHENASGFGTFGGVFVPNITMMFGVILFLRLGLVVGYVGIVKFLLIVAIALTVMLVTARSIGMIVTNMNVGGGGAYYLISRSLGIEIGGAIGIALVLSQLISLVLCTTGFAYSLANIFPDLSILKIEVLTLVGLLTLSSVSANLALKTQMSVFVILLFSVVSVFIYSQQITSQPLSAAPFFQQGLGFWEAFALFYPALTGIEAGMALSGNLKDPSKSLAYGNFWSLAFAAVTYTLVGSFLWYTFPAPLLESNPMIVVTNSKYPAIIYIGIWSATLSSALGNMLGAPRMLQMIAADNIAPKIFSRTYGRHNEPLYALAVIFVAALFMLLFTTIDQIIPVLSMICLLTYGTLNLVAGLAELIHSPSWRPTLKCPWQISMFGALACLSLMLMIDTGWTLISILVVGGVYLLLRSRSIEVSFQDLRQSIIFFFSRLALYRLSIGDDHPTNWLPQIVVCSRAPVQHERMIGLAYAMTRRSGILTVSCIVPELWEDPEQLERAKQVIKDWLAEKSIECLIETQAYSNFYDGIENMVKTYGIGSLQPNTFIVSVRGHVEEDLEELTRLIETAHLNGKNLMLYFDKEGEDISEERWSIQKKKIDLWWNPEHRASFELVLSYILAMRTSHDWSQRIVQLRTIVPDTTAKKHLMRHFQELFRKIRVRVKLKLEVNDPTTITKFSSDADLVFFPLRSINDFEYKEEYQKYLVETSKKLPDEIPVIAVASYDNVDHREIYYD